MNNKLNSKFIILTLILIFGLDSCKKDDVINPPKVEDDSWRPKEVIYYRDGVKFIHMELSYEDSRLMEALIFQYSNGTILQKFKMRYDYIGEDEIERILLRWDEGANIWETDSIKDQLKFNGELVSEYSDFKLVDNKWKRTSLKSINFTGNHIKDIYETSNYSDDNEHWDIKSEFIYNNDEISEVLYSIWNSGDNSISKYSKDVYFYSEGHLFEINNFESEKGLWEIEPRVQVLYNYLGDNLTSVEWNSAWSNEKMEFDYDENNNLIKHTYSSMDDISLNYIEEERVEYIYEKGNSNSKFLLSFGDDYIYSYYRFFLPFYLAFVG